MARRPSIASVHSLASSPARIVSLKSPLQKNVASPGFKVTNYGPSWPPRSASLHTNAGTNLSNGDINLDPDDLFTTYPVSEVKAIQHRLRADAEDKQEELRLMVGERYRDLLQASTSIISIAQSSKRVAEVLEETKGAIVAQEQSPDLHLTRLTGKDDVQLQTLQLLSAHMKLLLDAPEHLWRLIERKRFFEAAWLFLLARVVHRGLVRDGVQDEDSWNSQGIDVSEQFPLVGRQWEVVSQFRSQIVHKATLSLRECSLSTETICATLLTLHLLDARPLTETVSVFLAQRSKTLHTIFSKTPQPSGSSGSHPTRGTSATNGYLPGKYVTDGKSRLSKAHVREAKKTVQSALDAISCTVRATRDVFQEGPAVDRSMIGRVLEYMQSDSPHPIPSATILPAELLLTTQILLTSLPSSTYFLLLPSNLRSYKPYVDLSSSSSSVLQVSLARYLEEWFHKATKHLQEAMERYFTDVTSAKEIWKIRSWTWKWLRATSGLNDSEKTLLHSALDDVFRQRVIAIWKLTIANAKEAFSESLSSKILALQDASSNSIDISPIEYLFHSPALPNLSTGSAGTHFSDPPLHKYTCALRRQLIGRTSSLDDVLITLEGCANALQEDFSSDSIGDGDDTQTLAKRLTESFRPDAESLCAEVIKILNIAMDNHPNNSSTEMNSLIFIGQVAGELSCSSSFVSKIGCGVDASKSFRQETRALFDRIISRWRSQTVNHFIQEYLHSFHALSRGSLSVSSGPSSTLIQSLFSLSSHIGQLDIGKDHLRRDSFARETLERFIVDWLGILKDLNWQVLWDLLFLRKLASTWDAQSTKLAPIDEKVAQIRNELESRNGKTEKCDPGSNIDEHLARTQVLLAALLPLSSASTTSSFPTGKDEKFAPLLPYGTPSTDQQPFQAAVELAKPSSRFGLLLVGGTAG